MNPDTTTRSTDDDRDAPRTNGADHTLPLPPLADAEAVMRGMVQTYPLLTLAGAMLGGYAVARLLRRVR